MPKIWKVTAGLAAFVAALGVVVGVVIGRDGRDTIAFVAAALAYGVSTGGEVAQCARVVESFLQRHDLPKNSKSVPGRAAVFCNPGAKGYVFTTSPTVVIYGAVDRTLQNQYLSSLDAIRREMGAKTLNVEFYEQENWIEWKSKETGASGGDRGEESLIRKETLAQTSGPRVA